MKEEGEDRPPPAPTLPPETNSLGTPLPPVSCLYSSLTCFLCHGYLIDATKLVKCMHTFCRSCIFRHLETATSCPVCDAKAYSRSRAEHHLMRDETLQRLVYKIVPNLYREEMRRRRAFYADLAASTGLPLGEEDEEKLTPEERGLPDSRYFSPDDVFSIVLSCEASECGQGALSSGAFPRRYLSCPGNIRLSVLQKFVRNKFDLSVRFNVEIFCEDNYLEDCLTLVDVAYLTDYKRESPLNLTYRIVKRSAAPFKKPAPKTRDVEVSSSTPERPVCGVTDNGKAGDCVKEVTSVFSARKASRERDTYEHEVTSLTEDPMVVSTEDEDEPMTVVPSPPAATIIRSGSDDHHAKNFLSTNESEHKAHRRRSRSKGPIRSPESHYEVSSTRDSPPPCSPPHTATTISTHHRSSHHHSHHNHHHSGSHHHHDGGVVPGATQIVTAPASRKRGRPRSHPLPESLTIQPPPTVLKIKLNTSPTTSETLTITSPPLRPGSSSTCPPPSTLQLPKSSTLSSSSSLLSDGRASNKKSPRSPDSHYFRETSPLKSPSSIPTITSIKIKPIINPDDVSSRVAPKKPKHRRDDEKRLLSVSHQQPSISVTNPALSKFQRKMNDSGFCEGADDIVERRDVKPRKHRSRKINELQKDGHEQVSPQVTLTRPSATSSDSQLDPTSKEAWWQAAQAYMPGFSRDAVVPAAVASTSNIRKRRDPGPTRTSPRSTPVGSEFQIWAPVPDRHSPPIATTVPLTVSEARMKRWRELREKKLAERHHTNRISPGESEKSRFFKEALNLSLRPMSSSNDPLSEIPEAVKQSLLQRNVVVSPVTTVTTVVETVKQPISPPKPVTISESLKNIMEMVRCDKNGPASEQADKKFERKPGIEVQMVLPKIDEAAVFRMEFPARGQNDVSTLKEAASPFDSAVPRDYASQTSPNLSTIFTAKQPQTSKCSSPLSVRGRGFLINSLLSTVTSAGAVPSSRGNSLLLNTATTSASRSVSPSTSTCHARSLVSTTAASAPPEIRALSRRERQLREAIEYCITNLSGFFGALETIPERSRRHVRVACRRRERTLRKIVELTRRFATDVVPNQRERVLDLEAAVDAILAPSKGDESDVETVAVATGETFTKQMASVAVLSATPSSVATTTVVASAASTLSAKRNSLDKSVSRLYQAASARLGRLKAAKSSVDSKTELCSGISTNDSSTLASLDSFSSSLSPLSSSSTATDISPSVSTSLGRKIAADIEERRSNEERGPCCSMGAFGKALVLRKNDFALSANVRQLSRIKNGHIVKFRPSSCFDLVRLHLLLRQPGLLRSLVTAFTCNGARMQDISSSGTPDKLSSSLQRLFDVLANAPSNTKQRGFSFLQSLSFGSFGPSLSSSLRVTPSDNLSVLSLLKCDQVSLSSVPSGDALVPFDSSCPSSSSVLERSLPDVESKLEMSVSESLVDAHESNLENVVRSIVMSLLDRVSAPEDHRGYAALTRPDLDMVRDPMLAQWNTTTSDGEDDMEVNNDAPRGHSEGDDLLMPSSPSCFALSTSCFDDSSSSFVSFWEVPISTSEVEITSEEVVVSEVVSERDMVNRQQQQRQSTNQDTSAVKDQVSCSSEPVFAAGNCEEVISGVARKLTSSASSSSNPVSQSASPNSAIACHIQRPKVL